MQFSKKYYAKYTLQFTGWIILLLLITEVFTRFAIVSTPPLSSKVNGGGVEIYGIEGYGVIYYLPNMEIATPHSGGENIVTLGDSYTQARHSLFWKNYSSVAETELRSSGYNVDIRNFGYMASALPYYLGIGESLLETYHPKLIVIQIAANDLSSERVFDPSAPFYFKINEAGDIVVASSRQAEDYLKLSSRLQNPPAFTFTLRSSVETYLNIQHGQKNQRPDDNTGLPSANATNAAAPVAGLKAKQKLYAQELLLIKQTYGDTPILFIFRPVFSKQRLEFYYDNDTKDFIALIQKHSSWYVMFLDDGFNRSFKEGQSPIGFGNTDPFSGHWNVRGHEIAGKLLAERIAEILGK
jgi:hypothetical protein